MERKRWIKIFIMAFIFVFASGFLFSALANDVSLKVVKKWGKRVTINMENDTPVLGVECTLIDLPDVAKVKRIKTTSRTKGFLAQFNDLDEKGVKVVLLSLRGKAISPGEGPILEILYKRRGNIKNKKADMELTDVNIADINNRPVNVNLTGACF